MRLLSLILILISLVSYGQDRYNELLQIAKAKAGIVVSSRPMSAHLNPWVVEHHNQNNTILTDSLISQLVEAGKHSDTTKWTSKEFTRTAVIKDPSENLNARSCSMSGEWLTKRNEGNIGIN